MKCSCLCFTEEETEAEEWEEVEMGVLQGSRMILCVLVLT